MTRSIDRRVVLLLKLLNAKFTMVPTFLCHRFSLTRMKLSDQIEAPTALFWR